MPHSSRGISPQALWLFVPVLIIYLAIIFLCKKWNYNRYKALQDSGITTEAIVTKSKEFPFTDMKALTLEYEFQTDTGKTVKGRAYLDYSRSTKAKYALDKPIEIVYNPRTNFSFPKAPLASWANYLSDGVKILPYIMYSGIAIVFIIIYSNFFYSNI